MAGGVGHVAALALSTVAVVIAAPPAMVGPTHLHSSSVDRRASKKAPRIVTIVLPCGVPISGSSESTTIIVSYSNHGTKLDAAWYCASTALYGRRCTESCAVLAIVPFALNCCALSAMSTDTFCTISSDEYCSFSGGVTHDMALALMYVAAARSEPNAHTAVDRLRKPVPMTVTVVPPISGPRIGKMDRTTGLS